MISYALVFQDDLQLKYLSLFYGIVIKGKYKKSSHASESSNLYPWDLDSITNISTDQGHFILSTNLIGRELIL